MGSVWERRIRTARKIISVLMKTDGCSLTDESSKIFMDKTEEITS